MYVSFIGWHIEDMLAKLFGIEPVKLFSARSSRWRYESCESCHGILPWSIFDRSIRILKKGLVSRIHGGIVPEILLYARSRIVRFLKFFNIAEKDPVKLLLDRCSELTEDMELVIMVVTSPTKVLLDKSKNCRYRKLQMQLGSSPKSWLCDRSKTFNTFTWHNMGDSMPLRLEMVLVNLL